MPQSLIHTSQVTRKAKQSNSTGAILSIKNYGLEVILNALGLSECSLGQSIHQPTGPVLVAIDAENMSNKSQLRSANCQVGLAIFDPHCEAISTYNFVSGSIEYYSKVAPRFLFGESVHTEKSDIGKHVKSIYPESRDTILIGHSLHGELQVLKALHISLPFTCGVDTQRIALEVIPELTHPPSLSWLGNALGVPTNFRHCAGNDAHFTLVALLGLACFRPRSNSQSWHKLSSSFQKLRASIVDITLPVGSCREDMKKKEERRKCRRLENERNRELKRARRTAAKEAVAGHDWSAMLQETDLEKPRDQVRART
jgi:hypothetical protein